MNPASFPEANVRFGPPADMAESQVQSVAAFVGEVRNPGSSVDGSHLVLVAWMPTVEERVRIAAGGPIFFTCMGEGLPPHLLTTDFQEAVNPA